MDKETYDSLPLTRWPDKSAKPIEDHPELPDECPERAILKKKKRDANGSNAQVKNSEGNIKAKVYDLNQLEAGSAKIGEDLRGFFENLADDKPVVRNNGKVEPEVSS